MSVILVKDKLSFIDLQKAKEDYNDYIKVTVDVVVEAITVGGRWHADGEKLLMANGSKQSDIWGGGINLLTKQVETFALVNLKPNQNNDSQDILDAEIRKRFKKIVEEKFGL